jgi:hypothetical protein
MQTTRCPPEQEFPVRYEVLTAISMNNAVLHELNVLPCVLEVFTFQRNLLPPASGSKNEPNRQVVAEAQCYKPKGRGFETQ